MNKLIESIIKSEFPKIEVEIGIFEHKETKEIRFCIMSVSTGLTTLNHNYIYDASEWDKLDNKLLEGSERIQECFISDLYKLYTGEQ